MNIDERRPPRWRGFSWSAPESRSMLSFRSRRGSPLLSSATAKYYVTRSYYLRSILSSKWYWRSVIPLGGKVVYMWYPGPGNTASREVSLLNHGKRCSRRLRRVPRARVERSSPQSGLRAAELQCCHQAALPLLPSWVGPQKSCLDSCLVVDGLAYALCNEQ